MKKYYYTIGEVSNLVGIKKPTLRFWEKEFSKFFGSIRKSGGNRRYTNKQVEMFKTVQHLLYVEKFTIDGAKRQLKKKKTEISFRKELLEIQKLLNEEI